MEMAEVYITVGFIFAACVISGSTFTWFFVSEVKESRDWARGVMPQLPVWDKEFKIQKALGISQPIYKVHVKQWSRSMQTDISGVCRDHTVARVIQGNDFNPNKVTHIYTSKYSR